MTSFNFFPFLLVALYYTSTVSAAPWPGYTKHSTHRVRQLGNNFKLETFQPKSTFMTFGKGLESTNQGESFVASSLSDSAIAFIQSQLGVDASNVQYRSGFNGSVGRYAYAKQFHDGIPFANAVANVAWKDGKVVAFGSSFVNTTNIAPSAPSVDLQSVVSKVEELLEGKVNDQQPSLEFLARPDGSVALTHVVQIQNDTSGAFLEAFVDAHTGEVISVTDFVTHASYTVVPIAKAAFPDGEETLTDPQDTFSSPFGWHSDGVDNTTSTLGNNVAAFVNRTFTNESAPGLVFDFEYSDQRDPTVRSNVDAARTNAFYIANTVHDIAYRYGFTEEAFNFQDSNFNHGGRGGDSVLLSVQDPSGVNNANFATPPDGQSGVCRMFIWDRTNPRRDGALENAIIVHELTHGITNRMTGGGTGRCLQSTEAGGMGEGWSDAMAEWVQQKSAKVEDFVLGNFVLGSNKGIRKFPYSTDPTVNPLRYSSIAQLNEVHNIGEVWANMLHNVYAALVAERGFSETAFTNVDGTQGNVVFMHLFIDALALQPCNPTFVSARDAWIQADENRYNGANKCTLFKAFASRGLGLNAGSDFVDNADVPAGC